MDSPPPYQEDPPHHLHTRQQPPPPSYSQSLPNPRAWQVFTIDSPHRHLHIQLDWREMPPKEHIFLWENLWRNCIFNLDVDFNAITIRGTIAFSAVASHLNHPGWRLAQLPQPQDDSSSSGSFTTKSVESVLLRPHSSVIELRYTRLLPPSPSHSLLKLLPSPQGLFRCLSVASIVLLALILLSILVFHL